jgi:hypothetical protein
MNIKTNLHRSAFDAQVQELSEPPAESFSLAATLQLLDPFETTNTSTDDDTNNNNTSAVYLMTPSYLQNWLFWAFHQNVKKGESNRLVEALKLAAKRYGLTPPQDASPQDLEDYADPGPIDATFLSLNEGEGNDLVLSPNVLVKEGEFDRPNHNKTNLDAEFPELLRRVKSLPIVSKKNRTIYNGYDNDDDLGGTTMLVHPSNIMDVEGDKILCCAVPSRFYEVSDSFSVPAWFGTNLLLLKPVLTLALSENG